MVVRTLPLRRLALGCLLALIAALPAVLTAHEIPNDVTIQTFVKPEGQRLELLVRVPLIAIRDIIFPQKDADNIDLSRSDRQLEDAAILWLGDDMKAYEGDVELKGQQVLAVRATPAEDRSFETFDAARALLAAPQRDVDVALKTGYLDILFGYPIQSASSRFSLDPAWARLGVRTLVTVRLIKPDGETRAFELYGNPGRVLLDPTAFQAARRFGAQGFRHVLLDRTDHILFLICLVIPFRRVRSLLAIAASFIAAYTITLTAWAYGFGPDSLWFPPLIETLIGVSIVYVGIENILGARLDRRWLVAFGFGLAHGFGFAFPLTQDLQFAGSHLLASVLAFNLGVIVSLVLVIALSAAALSLLWRLVPERLGTIILSGVLAHSGWHWTVDRFNAFRLYDFTVPELTPAFLAELLRYAMAAVAIGGLLWLVSLFTKRRDDAQATS